MSDIAILRIQVDSKGVKTATKDLDALNRTTGTATKQTQQATQAQKGFGDQLTQSSGRLKVIARDLTAFVSVPLTLLGAKALEATNAFNKGLANVQALIPNTGNRINELKDEVLGLGAEFGRSFDDINRGLYRTISVFQDGEDTVDRLNTALRASIAGNATVADSVQLLSSVTRAYGDTSAEAVEKVADLAFEAVRLGDTTFPALAQAMQVATDRAVRLGVSQEELFTVMATLTGITGDASMVATQFRSAMDSLLRPTDALKELLAQMGFTSAEAAIEQEGLIGILTAINSAATKANRPLQDFITRKEGITLASRLATQQLGDYNFRLQEITRNSGAAADAFDAVKNGVNEAGEDFEEAKQRLEGAIAVLGENVVPIVTTFTNALASLVEGFNALPAPVQKFLTLISALIIPLSTFVFLWGVFKSLEIANAFAGIANAAAAAGISLGWIAVAVVGVVALAAAIWDAVEAHKEMVKAVEDYKDAAEDIAREDVFILETPSFDAEKVDAITSSMVDFVDRYGSLNKKLIDDLTNNEVDSALEIYKGRLEEVEKARREATLALVEQFRGPSAVPEAGLAVEQELLERGREYLAAYEQVQKSIADELKRSSAEVFGEETISELPPEFFDNYAKNYQDWLRAYQRTGNDIKARTMLVSRDLGNSIIEALDLSRQFPRGATAGLGDGEGFEFFNTIQKQLNLLGESFTAQDANLGAAFEALGAGDIIDQQNTLQTTIELLEKLKGEFVGVTGAVGDNRKQWQEWFSEITDTPLGDFVDRIDTDINGRLTFIGANQGARAARAWMENFRNTIATDRTIQEAVGNAFSPSDATESQIDDGLEQLAKLFAIRAEQIANGEVFRITDKSIAGLIENIKTLKQELAISKIEDWDKAMVDLADATLYSAKAQEMLGESFSSNGVARDIMQEQIEELIELREELIESDLDYADAIAEINERLADLAHAYENTIPSYEQANEGLKDFQTTVAELAYEGLSDFAKAMGATAEEAGQFGAIFSNIIAEVGTTAILRMADAWREVGKGIATGVDAQENLSQALSNYALQILNILPSLFMQAGLQAIASGNIPLGLALLGAGLSTSFVGGFVEGAIESRQNDASGTTTNASGNVFTAPHYFNSFNGRNLMGEAGPEAVMPLARTRTGDLGVQMASGGAGASVEVNIINQAGADVETRERDTPDGKVIDVMVRKAVKKGFSEGQFDSDMRGRYGVRVRGIG